MVGTALPSSSIHEDELQEKAVARNPCSLPLAKAAGATGTGGKQAFVHPLSRGSPLEGQKFILLKEWSSELQPGSAVPQLLVHQGCPCRAAPQCTPRFQLGAPLGTPCTLQGHRSKQTSLNSWVSPDRQKLSGRAGCALPIQMEIWLETCHWKLQFLQKKKKTNQQNCDQPFVPIFIKSKNFPQSKCWLQKSSCLFCFL